MVNKLNAIQPIQPIREIVYQQLKLAVQNGAFAAGERLLEHDIAEKLQVSRTPVREALQRLETEGFLETLPKQGLVVKEYSDDDVREIYMIREALECLAAEFAAINATDSDIARLEAFVAEMDRLDEDADVIEEIELHSRFSEAYNKASHMPTLVRLTESLKDQISRFRNVSLNDQARRLEARKEHKELLDALKRRDPERASRLTHIHLRNALTAVSEKQRKSGSGDRVKNAKDK